MFQKDVQLPNGDIMPKNMQFMIDFASMCRNEQVFKDPNKFHPERFLEPNKGQKNKEFLSAYQV